MTAYIALDIGGTQLRLGVFSDGSELPKSIVKIPTQATGETSLGRLISLVADNWPQDEPVGAIGAAIPGPVDPHRGIVHTCPNIPGWDNLPLQNLLEERFNVPTALGNDANLAALGEWAHGAGRGHHNLLYLTISTGIGGGVIIDDRMLLGENGLAAELGHMTIEMDGPLCGCGQPGHLEAIASGTGIAHWIQTKLAAGAPSSLANRDPITARIAAEAAQSGDNLAMEAFRYAGYALGIGVANYLHIFNPSVIVFGGGVSRSGDLIFGPMREALQSRVFTPGFLDGLEIKMAALGDDAGLMGALALANQVARA